DLLPHLRDGGGEGDGELRQLLQGLPDRRALAFEEAAKGGRLPGGALAELPLRLVDAGVRLVPDVGPERGEVPGRGGGEPVLDTGRHRSGTARRRQLAEETVQPVADLLFGSLGERCQVLRPTALEPGRGDGQDLVVEARGPWTEEREAAEGDRHHLVAVGIAQRGGAREVVRAVPLGEEAGEHPLYEGVLQVEVDPRTVEPLHGTKDDRQERAPPPLPGRLVPAARRTQGVERPLPVRGQRWDLEGGRL